MSTYSSNAFADRHIGPREREIAEMLAALGLDSLDALVDAAVPAGIRRRTPMTLGRPLTEPEALAELARIAQQNRVMRSMIGMGYHGCHTPTVILRNILENPAWYTAYTPYQAEISQGRLELLMNFQTLVSDLTALPVANASLLDEATAAAEAMAMCHRVAHKPDRPAFVVSSACHPQTIAVVRTRAEPLGIEVRLVEDGEVGSATDAFGALLQYPHSTGELVDPTAAIAKLHERGTRVVVAADLLSLTLVKPPGELGADIAVGTTQRFGMPMGCGGPHAAYIAVADDLKRTLPGRLVGASRDAAGRVGYRLALQTREQHIRRERATSNICTAQVLPAIVASLYAVYHGAEGLRAIAEQIHVNARTLAGLLRSHGHDVRTRSFFDTLAVRTGDRTDAILEAAVAAGYNFRRVDEATIALSVDETTTAGELPIIAAAFGGERGAFEPTADPAAIPHDLARRSAYLTHPVFERHRSETELLRYMRSLADKDLALDRTMIPLGSCTMKLNATTEMIPITWPQLANVHPYAPRDQLAGYEELAANLERDLCAITGYDAVSLQPNAGSQGELAGLLAIRAWHASRGEPQRAVCLIPSSAHGTNPASAQMAGLKVVVVKCSEEGDVDLEDLRARASQHASSLAALMITYPSTHGVFEEAIREICDVVHTHGGQVYLDGANMNAMVGLAAPGELGADVSHLNLHKTFCIPHGGGGPGVGPIAVKAHLKPFLPGHLQPFVLSVAPAKSKDERSKDQPAVGPISAAPWGNAGVLPISLAYIAMMGAEGLTRASAVAILNANYIRHRLERHYPMLYTGANGMVAHECIVDVRPLKDSVGVSVTDVAKRLIDYGFHAPTVSFPVPGTMMIEPTESESKRELDRFCDAMIAIREEIRRIEKGDFDREDNPLVNAPHTAESIASDDWPHAYSRMSAAYPQGAQGAKYWPPVRRIDEIAGDRNLMCTCPPLSDYDAAVSSSRE
ncbi:MAG TPA: aminomethyl-transferring glycine dehydrogenase [Burkholderiales bacterium]|nr:aminomethyl-transferring glycine dehydrogenase [Burkholderiales bacterium]